MTAFSNSLQSSRSFLKLSRVVVFSLVGPQILLQKTYLFIFTCLFMYVCLHIWVCTICVPCPCRTGTGIWSPRNGVTGGCDLSCWCWELNPGLLLKQVLLTIEMSLQSQDLIVWVSLEFLPRTSCSKDNSVDATSIPLAGRSKHILQPLNHCWTERTMSQRIMCIDYRS